MKSLLPHSHPKDFQLSPGRLPVMVQKSGELVGMVNIHHYLQGFIQLPAGFYRRISEASTVSPPNRGTYEVRLSTSPTTTVACGSPPVKLAKCQLKARRVIWGMQQKCPTFIKWECKGTPMPTRNTY